MDSSQCNTDENARPTMGETFNVYNKHGAPPEFIAELNALAPARLRAIYLACMPIDEDVFNHGCDSDRIIWADAKEFVARCPIVKPALAEIALLVLARSVF